MAVWNVIQHTELSGSANYFEKTSISSSYDHLYFLASIRGDVSAYTDWSSFQLNGDTTDSNYDYQYLRADGTGSLSTGFAGYAWGSYFPAASAGADNFGCVEMWIPNYANSTNKKSVLTRGVAPNDSTTTGQFAIDTAGTLWNNTAAINAFKFMVYGGSDNFVQYSTFTLYGINGAG
tara:strand:- start:87 stop:617 length:531 start_codon:yes stop_codon:yes gene_type:complete